MKAQLTKTVFNKNKFTSTVDTTFSQLVEKPNPSFFDINLATIEDFFTLYNKFFFQIPKTGTVNSHEYLVTESGNYIGYEQNNTEINSLLDQITQLQQQNATSAVDFANSIASSINSTLTGTQ
jgi:hypothetical protein